jgi:hypothetical protein
MSEVRGKYSPSRDRGWSGALSDSDQRKIPFLRLLNVPCPHCLCTMRTMFIESDGERELTTLGCSRCGFERIVARPRR